MQPRDFMYYALTGMPVTDPSLASRTMLWDIAARPVRHRALRAGGRPRRPVPGRPAFSVRSCGAVRSGGPTPGAARGTPRGRGRRGSAVRSPGGGSHRCPGHGILGDHHERLAGAHAAAAPPRWQGQLLDVRPAGRGAGRAGHDDDGRPPGLGPAPGVRGVRPGPGDRLCRSRAQRAGARGLLVLPFFMGAKATRWVPVRPGSGHRSDARSRARRSPARGHGGHRLRGPRLHRRPGGDPRGSGRGRPHGGREPLGRLGTGQGRRPGPGARQAPPWRSRAFGAMLLAAAAVGSCDDPVAWARRLNPVERLFEPGADAGRYQALAALYERAWEEPWTSCISLQESPARPRGRKGPASALRVGSTRLPTPPAPRHPDALGRGRRASGPSRRGRRP